MAEHRVAERRDLRRQASLSLRLIDPKGNHRMGYIEHSTKRYLVARGRDICCEPMKKEDKNFEHRLVTHYVMNDENAKFFVRTFSRQDQSSQGVRTYMGVTKDKTISLQELNLSDSKETIPDNEEIVFFKIQGLPHDFVCFESTEFEMNFLAVDKDNDYRVCLKQLTDHEEASRTAMVQFKVNYIH